MPNPRTAGEMLLAVRDSLDERNEAFWQDQQLYRYLTRAADNVHTECRKLKADYHLVGRSATQGVVTIFGAPYDCGNLRFMPDSIAVTLPPDLLELTLVECLTPEYPMVTFDLSKKLNHPDFRAARKMTATAPAGFLGCVVAENLLGLSPQTTVPIDLGITYVSSGYISTAAGAIVTSFTAPSDLFVMPFPLYQAVELWATAFAHLQDRNPTMAGEYEKRAMAVVTRTMGADARQTQDPVFVVGQFE